MGPGPAPRPGPGHRIRHRRLDLQRARAAGRRLPVDDHRAAPHRPRRLRRDRPIRPWPAAWPRRRNEGGADLLFVGKVSPHKGQHDLVKALAAYRRLYDPEARLHLVGGAISDEYQHGRRAVRRRARPARRGGDRRLGHPRGADRLLRRRRRLRLPLQPRGLLRAPARGHVPPAAHRGLHQHRGPRDGAGCRADPPQQGAGAGGGGHRPGGQRSPSSGPCWPRRPPSGWPPSPCPGCRDGFASALEAACAA